VLLTFLAPLSLSTVAATLMGTRRRLGEGRTILDLIFQNLVLLKPGHQMLVPNHRHIFLKQMCKKGCSRIRRVWICTWSLASLQKLNFGLTSDGRAVCPHNEYVQADSTGNQQRQVQASKRL
jgi:hypothetical protein